MAEQAGAMAPSEAYRQGVARGEWDDDPAQHGPLAALDRVQAELLARPRRGWLARTLGGGGDEAPRGLYLWGGVGRGKTFLVDLFYGGLPLPAVRPGAGGGDGNGKHRTHFHRFMRGVHERLREHAGERDPLAAIVAGWRRSLRVLVLDEFFVGDIGDAMLLGRLLERMFAEGIVLVTTSNIEPGGLYAGGLQRARFLPAIALLERHCQVLEIISDTDYRLRELTRPPVYRAPLDAGSDGRLEARLPRHGLVRFRRALRGPARRVGLHRDRDRVPHGAAGRDPGDGRPPRRRRAALRHLHRRGLRPQRETGLHRRRPRARAVRRRAAGGRLRAHRFAPDRDAVGRVPGAAPPVAPAARWPVPR